MCPRGRPRGQGLPRELDLSLFLEIKQLCNSHLRPIVMQPPFPTISGIHEPILSTFSQT